MKMTQSVMLLLPSVFGQLLDNNNTWLWNDLVIFVRVIRTFNSLTCNNIHEKITQF